MGMYCSLVEVDEDQIDDLLADPEGVRDFIEEAEEEGEAEVTDLDKSWHGIHFLLTGSAWEGEEPLCYLVKGGREIGDEDGSARILKPEQVADWADALSTISTDDLRKRFNPEAMIKADIDPRIWDRAPEEPEGDNTLEYLLENYDGLRYFVEEAKNGNKGLIVYLS